MCDLECKVKVTSNTDRVKDDCIGSKVVVKFQCRYTHGNNISCRKCVCHGGIMNPETGRRISIIDMIKNWRRRSNKEFSVDVEDIDMLNKAREDGFRYILERTHRDGEAR